MTAAAKAKAGKARETGAPLTFAIRPAGDLYEPNEVRSEIAVETSGSWDGPPVRLFCSIVERDDSLARGEPVNVLFALPNYDHLDGRRDFEERLCIPLDEAEQLCEGMLHCVREAKRLGFGGPALHPKSA